MRSPVINFEGFEYRHGLTRWTLYVHAVVENTLWLV